MRVPVPMMKIIMKNPNDVTVIQLLSNTSKELKMSLSNIGKISKESTFLLEHSPMGSLLHTCHWNQCFLLNLKTLQKLSKQ